MLFWIFVTGVLYSGSYCLDVDLPIDLPSCNSTQCDELKGYCLKTNNSNCSCLGVIDCSIPITDCSCSVDGNPCYNGQCVDKEEGGYSCNCSYGWSGKYCHIDEDFCHTSANETYCVHGQCIEGVGPEVHCDCSDNYHGESCDKIFCSDGYCKNGGVCQVTGNDTIACECKTGYYGDQCENEVPNCNKEDCKYISGVCYPADESTVEDNCTCFGVLNCTTPITHCSMADPYVACLHGGECQNKTNDSITCTCMHQGLTGDHCETSVTVCEYIDCSGHGKCIEGLGTNNSPHCDCDELYTGKNCEECHCPDDYCKNGGTCNNGSSGTTCVNCACMPEYTGETCEIDNTDVCNGNTCYNNGTCIEKPGFNFECACDYGFTGERCADKLSPCELIPCLNNGTCNNSQCTCEDGFGGDSCEIDLIDVCGSNNPCLNGGTCIDGPGSIYDCLCPNGYRGKECETDIHYCDYLETSICGGCQESIGDSVMCSNCSKMCNCNMCACRPSYCDQHYHQEMIAITTNISCRYEVQSLGLSVTISCSCDNTVAQSSSSDSLTFPSSIAFTSSSPMIHSSLPTTPPIIQYLTFGIIVMASCLLVLITVVIIAFLGLIIGLRNKTRRCPEKETTILNEDFQLMHY